MIPPPPPSDPPPPPPQPQRPQPPPDNAVFGDPNAFVDPNLQVGLSDAAAQALIQAPQLPPPQAPAPPPPPGAGAGGIPQVDGQQPGQQAPLLAPPQPPPLQLQPLAQQPWPMLNPQLQAGMQGAMPQQGFPQPNVNPQPPIMGMMMPGMPPPHYLPQQFYPYGFQQMFGLMSMPIPVYDGDPSTFRTITNTLENQCHFRGIEYTLIQDTQRRDMESAHLFPMQKRQDQRTLYSLLHHIFHKELPSYVNYPDKGNPTFATDMWGEICKKVHPSDTLSARDYINQLQAAIVFKGEIEEYMKKIRRISDKLASLGHRQSDLLIVSQIHSAILNYAARASDPLQQQWANFIATLQINAPNSVLTMDLIEKHGVLYQRQIAHNASAVVHEQGIYALTAQSGDKKCSYCGGGHRFSRDTCEKWKYDKKHRGEERGRQQQRHFDVNHRSKSPYRSNSRGKSPGRRFNRGHSSSRSRSRSGSRGKVRFSSNRDSQGRNNSDRYRSKSPQQRCWNCGSPHHLKPACPFPVKKDYENNERQDRWRDRSRSRDRDKHIKSRDHRSYHARLSSPSEKERGNSVVSQPEEQKTSSILKNQQPRPDSPHPSATPDASSFLQLAEWAKSQSFRPFACPAIAGEPENITADGTTSIPRLISADVRPFPRINITAGPYPRQPSPSAYLTDGSGPPSRSPNSFNMSRNPMEHHFIVDSGSNRHLVADERFIVRGELVSVQVNGLGDSIRATAQGPILARLRDSRNNRHDFLSWGLFIPTSDISIFSTIQALLAGNHIIHEGNPETGCHGLYIPSRQTFIPFTWDPVTTLFWIKMEPIPEPPLALTAHYGSTVIRRTDSD